MNAKKLFVWLLVVCLLAVSFCSCGNKNNSSNTPEETTDAPIDTTPVEIEDEGIDFWMENNAGFDNAIEGTAEDFEYEIVNETTITILAYKGTNEHLMIPSTMEDLPVTVIANGAFAENITLKTLVIPKNIQTIGTGVLKGCENLHSLQTPLMGENKASTQYLGYLFGATQYKDNPKDIPASLKCLRMTGEWQTLPAYSLYDCNDLICLDLPDKVTVIEKFALCKCASLKQIDGLENVVTFGDRALMDCSDLQILTLGNALESVGFAAFEGCDSIRSLTLPFVGYSRTENTYLGYIFGASHIDFAKGFYPKNLARVTVTDACKTLDHYAFFECTSLKEIILPDEGLTSIGVRAFYGCTSLWNVKIPNSVTTIRELAFANCDALIAIDFGKGLTTIGINAFYNCDSLAEIALPEALQSIPASCFAGCISLTKIDFGGVREVGAEAFRHCNAVATVTATQKIDFEKGNDSVKSILNSK